MNADAVTIPMTKKDDNGNVHEYRITPLAFDDARFKTIAAQLGKDMRNKFLKLYKRTKDAEARTPAVEMSAFLASFVFDQLIGWYGVLVEISGNPKMAAMNTFHIFGETFKHLSAEMGRHENEKKEKDTSADPGDAEKTDAADSEDKAASDGPEEADGSDSEAGGADEERKDDDSDVGVDSDGVDAPEGTLPMPPEGDPVADDTPSSDA
jgi:hypothetical protein